MKHHFFLQFLLHFFMMEVHLCLHLWVYWFGLPKSTFILLKILVLLKMRSKGAEKLRLKYFRGQYIGENIRYQLKF